MSKASSYNHFIALILISSCPMSSLKGYWDKSHTNNLNMDFREISLCLKLRLSITKE